MEEVMSSEDLIKQLKGTYSEEDNERFTQTLMEIAKDENCNNKREPDPTYEALETLEDFLEELDEFYGLVALKYGSEASDALETLRSWYLQRDETENR